MTGFTLFRGGLCDIFDLLGVPTPLLDESTRLKKSSLIYTTLSVFKRYAAGCWSVLVLNTYCFVGGLCFLKCFSSLSLALSSSYRC